MESVGHGSPLGRTMRVLLIGILLFHAAWYLLLPYFVVLFTTRRGLTPVQAGLVLSLQSLAVVAGSIFGGVSADRFGRRLTMTGGLWLRAVAVGVLGIATSLPVAMLAALAAGFGGGLYGPAAKAAIAMLSTGEEERATAFSYRGMAASVGVAVGPAIGAVLVPRSMLLLFGTAALIHVTIALMTGVLPAGRGVEATSPRPRRRELVSQMPFFWFSTATAVAWALFSQLAVALPLYASRVLGLEASIGLLWTATSALVILLQVPVTRYLISRIKPMPALALGAVLLGAGLGLIGLMHSFYGLLGAVAVFALGEMLLLPSADSVTALMAAPGKIGAYFGVASLAWGVGEGIGVLSGGWLMGYALRTGLVARGMPWGIYGAAGLALGTVFWALNRWRPLQSQLSPASPAERARIQLFRPGHPAPAEGLPEKLAPAGNLPDHPGPAEALPLGGAHRDEEV